MATFTAVFDACVLHPEPLCNLLMHLTLTDLFRARWTDEIHREWMRSVQEARPGIDPAKLQRRREAMDEAVPDCLVTGYEPWIERITLPDAKDRHIVAAAIKCQAGVIVTYNLRDFPMSALAAFDLEAQHPDEFIRHLGDLAPGPVCSAAREHRASYIRRPVEVDAYLDMLSRQGLAETVEWLRGFSGVL